MKNFFALSISIIVGSLVFFLAEYLYFNEEFNHAIANTIYFGVLISIILSITIYRNNKDKIKTKNSE
jgi:hypothetical protein